MIDITTHNHHVICQVLAHSETKLYYGLVTYYTQEYYGLVTVLHMNMIITDWLLYITVYKKRYHNYGIILWFGYCTVHLVNL